MQKRGKTKGKKIPVLPFIAAVLAVAALIVVFFPKHDDAGADSRKTGGENSQNDAAQIDGEGKLVIRADQLSREEVSFIRVSGDSNIEILARLGDDGTAKAALGTCQSCNGSPGAYYTQQGDELKCNNCGLTFPVSVLDSPGGGCHPIMLDDETMQREGDDLVIDLEKLSAYEALFAKVEAH